MILQNALAHYSKIARHSFEFVEVKPLHDWQLESLFDRYCKIVPATEREADPII